MARSFAREPARGEAESSYAWLRVAASLALMTLGGAGMYSVVVALPAVQAEFASEYSSDDHGRPYRSLKSWPSRSSSGRSRT